MKNAQIQSGETIIVLVIIGVLIVFGVIFMSGIQRDSATIELTQQQELNSLALASQIGNLPELRCTRRTTTIERCIDLYKAKSLSQFLQSEENQEFRNERFGNTNISLIVKGPKLPTHYLQINQVINITDPINTDTTRRIPVYIPIIVIDPITQTNYFATLEVVAFN